MSGRIRRGWLPRPHVPTQYGGLREALMSAIRICAILAAIVVSLTLDNALAAPDYVSFPAGGVAYLAVRFASRQNLSWRLGYGRGKKGRLATLDRLIEERKAAEKKPMTDEEAMSVVVDRALETADGRLNLANAE